MRVRPDRSAPIGSVHSRSCNHEPHPGRPARAASGQRPPFRRKRSLRSAARGELFTPDADATWLLTEIDPDDGDRAFGLFDLGLGFFELGYVSLAELTTVRGPLRPAIERDLHFLSDKPISVYARQARMAGRIVA